MSKTLLVTVIALGLFASPALAEGGDRFPNDPSRIGPHNSAGPLWYGMINGPTILGPGTVVPLNAQYYATYNGHTYLIDHQHRVMRIVR
jgi:hypothetical protein